MGSGPDFDGLELVQCWNERHNLNFDMVLYGAALANRSHTHQFVAQEGLPSRRGIGLWSGSFEPPWEWRKRQSKI